MAAALHDALPTGSLVAVCWREPHEEPGSSASRGAPAGLIAQAEIALHAGSRNNDDLHCIDFAWDAAHDARAAIAAALPVPLSEPSRSAWLLLARRVVEAHIAANRAQARAESLEKSERLQQALYEIADLAGSDLEMPDLLCRIHGVVGGLM
ncbi:MAG TPA: hypothetical protein VK827_03355, partial [Lysobacter sp.]|nr:hypothetical protein [Lysobacter sp.]